MSRLQELLGQERRALDRYDRVVSTMLEAAEREAGGVRSLGQSFEAALSQLDEATRRVATCHMTLVRALRDARGGSGMLPEDAPSERELAELDRRREALAEKAGGLRDVLAERRDRMSEELSKVRRPRKPRSIYRDGNQPSMIDVSG
jgi:chromosome segregation ATPase